MAKRTTKKHFKAFVRECRRWIRLYGFVDWDIGIAHEKLGPNLAQTRHNNVARNCVIALCRKWKDQHPLTVTQVRKAAFHEMNELLFADLHMLATDAGADEEAVNKATHAILHTMEHVFWKK